MVFHPMGGAHIKGKKVPTNGCTETRVKPNVVKGVRLVTRTPFEKVVRLLGGETDTTECPNNDLTVH